MGQGKVDGFKRQVVGKEQGLTKGGLWQAGGVGDGDVSKADS